MTSNENPFDSDEQVSAALDAMGDRPKAEPVLTPLPCPFCGAGLTPNTNQDDLYVKRYGTHYTHPLALCVLSDLEVSPSGIVDWNRREGSRGASNPAEPVRAFLDFFLDRGEMLFLHFGMEAVNLYNAAALYTRSTAPETALSDLTFAHLTNVLADWREGLISRQRASEQIRAALAGTPTPRLRDVSETDPTWTDPPFAFGNEGAEPPAPDEAMRLRERIRAALPFAETLGDVRGIMALVDELAALARPAEQDTRALEGSVENPCARDVCWTTNRCVEACEAAKANTLTRHAKQRVAERDTAPTQTPRE